jgi:long-chain acyl-CoA synthetase
MKAGSSDQGGEPRSRSNRPRGRRGLMRTDFETRPQPRRHVLRTRAAEQGGKPVPVGKRDGKWQSLSWAEGGAARSVLLAESNCALGLSEGDRVMLVSENRPEWCIADLAIMAAGWSPCRPTPPTPSAITCTFSKHSGARAVIVVQRPSWPSRCFPRCCRAVRAGHVIGIEPLRQIGQAGAVRFHRWGR